MITCPKCSKELNDDAKFCVHCGTAIGSPTASAEPTVAQPVATEPAVPFQPTVAPKKEKKPLQIPKKWLAIGGGALALVLVVAIVLGIVLSSGGKEKNYALYIKDGEMFYMDIAKMESAQVTNDLIGNSDLTNSDLASAAYGFAMYTVLSRDGNTIFYLDEFEDDSDGFSLYFRSLKDLSQEPTKVDSNISEYAINEECNCITYLKNDALYQHNMVEKIKIDSDVSSFRVTADGKKIVYRTDDGDVYYKNYGTEPEKAVSNVESLYFADESLSAILYTKEGNLYKKVEGHDQEKITSEVDSVISVYESGEVLYRKDNELTLALKDFFEDDMAAEDAAFTEPVEPIWPTASTYPYSWNYATTEEYQAALTQYNTDYEAYQAAKDQYYIDYDAYREARDLYYEKESRDSLRESIAEEVITLTTSALYYYNGTEEKLVTDSYISTFDSASATPTLIFSAYDTTGISKVKMSEASYLYEIRSAVQEQIKTKRYVAVKDALQELEVAEEITNISYVLSDDGKTIYYTAQEGEDDDNHGDLYKIVIADGKLQVAEPYDTDVYVNAVYFIEEGRLAYWKDVNDSNGEFYINKERIDYDVALYSVSLYEKDNMLVYYTDRNASNQLGTLKVFMDGTATKIADDVYNYTVTPNGEILYLYDYSTSSYCGELYLFKNGKKEKVDEDVTTLIPVIAR